jgi:exonuclease SbcC
LRPNRLVVRGFRSYADEATFDFTDRSLVGVVGPIGSGKSTLLDAVSFALYGQTPTVGKQTKSLINQRQESAHVELWFGVGDDLWRAVRALRRKGQSAHSLERYSEMEGDRLELVEGEKGVNARVADLLGLDFHAFGRSVLLAQNQFARFLDATGGERDAVLKGVFGLDRIEAVRELAKARRDAAARDLEELDRRRAEVEADRGALEVARRELEPTAAAAEAFEAAAAAESMIVAAEKAAVDDAAKAEAAVAELKELAGRLPSRTETAALLAASVADADAIAAAEKDLEAAVEKEKAVRRRLDEVIAAGGDREALARLDGTVSGLADLEAGVAAADNSHRQAVASAHEASRGVSTAQKALEAAGAAVAAASAEHELAVEKVKEAEASLHAASHDEMAAALRSGLQPGDPCPVCGREVAKLRAVSRPASLRGAEKAVDRATAGAAKAGTTLAGAQETLTTAAAASAAATVKLDSATAAVEARAEEAAKQRDRHGAAQRDVAEALGAGEPGRLLTARWKALHEAEKAAEDQAAVVAAAAEKLAAARDAFAERQTAMQRLATEVATLGGTLGADISSTADGEALAGALDRLRELWETTAAAAEDGVKEAARRLESARGDKAQLYRELGLAADDDFASARVRAQAALAAVKEKVSLLEGRLARVTELEEQNATTVARLAVFGRLSDDLAPSKFLAYLLDEERVALAELAADRFETLSGGRYRFSEDGSFDVIDLTAADAVRRPRSLSGGESFLASLALALALAEMVSRSGGRLGSFFLDEGFGSLDAEHLDLAMEGVERIVTDNGDRLVVVVSHVPELRQRLEDVIELEKHPVTGDTVVARA